MDPTLRTLRQDFKLIKFKTVDYKPFNGNYKLVPRVFFLFFLCENLVETKKTFQKYVRIFPFQPFSCGIVSGSSSHINVVQKLLLWIYPLGKAGLFFFLTHPIKTLVSMCICIFTHRHTHTHTHTHTHIYIYHWKAYSFSRHA
jgi:hypothetical protein